MNTKMTYLQPKMSVTHFLGENVTTAVTHASAQPVELLKVGAYAGNISFNKIVPQNPQTANLLDFN